MSNMSYCRFRNTLRDLEECDHALHTGDAFDNDIDPEEASARDKLIKLCAGIAEDHHKPE